MSTSKKPIILIVDDDPEFHQNLVFAFSEYTLISTYEEDGAKAVASQINVDMVLSDLNLDNRCGRFDRGKDLISWIAHEKPELSIVAVTNYFDDQENFMPVTDFGADTILFKKDYEIKKWKETFEEYLNK